MAGADRDVDPAKMDRGRVGEEFCRTAVRRSFVGFAPLPLKLKADFEAKYGVRMIENYGLSETLFVTARSGDGGSETGYVGEVLPGITLRVVRRRSVAAHARYGRGNSDIDPGSDGRISG